MRTMTDRPRDLAFVLSEDGAGLSRDEVTIAAGSGVLEAGTVLGVVTASKKHTAHKSGVNTGEETAAAVLAYRTDATTADARAVVISRIAQVKKPMLVFDASVNDATKVATALAQLASKDIIAR